MMWSNGAPRRTHALSLSFSLLSLSLSISLSLSHTDYSARKAHITEVMYLLILLLFSPYDREIHLTLPPWHALYVNPPLLTVILHTPFPYTLYVFWLLHTPFPYTLYVLWLLHTPSPSTLIPLHVNPHGVWSLFATLYIKTSASVCSGVVRESP